MKVYQHLNAGNDVNGNPRRLYVIYDLDNAGDISAVIDEGYAGRGALHNAGIRADLIELAELDIPPAEYRRLLKSRPQPGPAEPFVDDLGITMASRDRAETPEARAQRVNFLANYIETFGRDAFSDAIDIHDAEDG